VPQRAGSSARAGRLPARPGMLSARGVVRGSRSPRV
jgi:hypothetical protein